MKKLLTLLATGVMFATPLASAYAYDDSASMTRASAGTHELKDGTKVEIAADGSVSLINADGTKTTAPDGTHQMKDGTALVVKNGKKVSG